MTARERARRRRRWRQGETLLGFVVLAWCVGFGWFVHRIVLPSAPAGDAQGIVVLTGGAGRMKKAFLLLLKGHAPRLLVSGVGADTSLAEIAGLAHVSLAALRGRVELGRGAMTTAGNAREAAAWVKRLHLRSLIVVTSFYHMPRAISDFREALPDIRLTPASVAPGAPMMAWPVGLWRVIAQEYCKWLAVEAGLGSPVAWLERQGL